MTRLRGAAYLTLRPFPPSMCFLLMCQAGSLHIEHAAPTNDFAAT